MKSILFSVLLLLSFNASAKVCKVDAVNFDNPGRSCRTGDIVRIMELTRKASNGFIAKYCNHSKSIAIIPSGPRRGMSATCSFRNNKR